MYINTVYEIMLKWKNAVLFFFSSFFVRFMCMKVLPVCMSMHYMYNEPVEDSNRHHIP